MKYCHRFFDYLYIDNNEGNICLCPWMEPSNASIGNLMTDDVADAYNSEYANYLRSTMEDQLFRFCRNEACPHIQNGDLPEITLEEYEHIKKESYRPDFEINLAYDFVCNQSCETCRANVFIPPHNYAEQMSAIQAKILPYLKTTKRITASGHGDPFASPYMMGLLENLHPDNPELSIMLETNGVFFDEAHWERIKHLADFNIEIVVTINSFNEFTYRHVSRGGNYDKMLHNLEFMSQLRKKGYIKLLSNSLVIQDRNFREIPSFVERSLSDYAFDRVILKPVYQWGTMDERVFWFKDVLNPLHPYHAEYLEILQDDALKDPRVYNFGGNTVHPARTYPSEGGVSFPYANVKKDSRIILYGAGQIGREYMRQISQTQYCSVVLQVDKNYCDECSVFAPSAIKKMKLDEFDCIVLATRNPKFIDEMMQVLEDLGIPNECIII